MNADTTLIGRRSFIGAGLAGAGLALVAPTRAAAVAGAPRADTPPAAASSTGAIGQMPLRAQYPHLPAIPLEPGGTAETLDMLSVRSKQITQAKQGLTHRYTLDGRTRTAYELLFGAAPAEPSPSLEHPAQFSMGWTTLPDVYHEGRRHLPAWTDSLTDADAATKQFWPMIAEHGTGYNLILPQRVTPAIAKELRRTFRSVWARDLATPAAAGELYVIDMRRFEALGSQVVNGAARFTPSTVTLLTRHRRSGALRPVAILVAGQGGRGRRLFTRTGATDGAWLYALQAAKTSITVFGVWLGHVYHWHLVTGAMQMTMLNTLPAGHPVRQMLAPQSKYLIAFDNVLISLWSQVAPPTSLTSATDLLHLANDYAAQRSFFDDDPKTTIAGLGLREADFTSNKPWDRYPVVRRALEVWELVEQYVVACVSAMYGSDAAVAGDKPLQAWIAASASPGPDGGNIRGLPEMTSRAALVKVLTSLVYRVTVHGASRLSSSSNPALTFVANFPQCLQRTDIPDPRAGLSTGELLTYLPNTRTIGESLGFYYVFTFSTPYEPFIPLAGREADLFFPGGPRGRRNRALVGLRDGLARFIDDYQPGMPQHFQWPRNVET